jgi:phosphoesterase RecJ-like protein
MISTALKTDLSCQLLNASNVLILTHQDPDFDAVGSSLAWYKMLTLHDIPATIYIADDIKNNFSFLPNANLIKGGMIRADQFDTILVLDSSDSSRVKRWNDLTFSEESVTVINIDHHSDNTGFGNYNIVENVSSVGELSFLLFSDLGWVIDEDIATCLYCAILFDTGGFMNSNVTAQTFHVCEHLLTAGATHNDIIETMYESIDVTDYDALKIMLSRLVVTTGFAYSTLPSDTPSSAINLISYIRRIKNIEVAFIVKETDAGMVKVSLRSKGNFNVSKFAGLFGGGGHFKASGIKVTAELDEFVQEITSRLTESLADPAFRL